MKPTPPKRIKSDFTAESLLIMENLGLTIYVAQLYERGLQNALTGLERLWAITIPPDTMRSSDGFVDSCLGPMLRILKSQGTVDREMVRLLEKAHYQRNLLAHRFIAENIVDMLNAAGREAVNEKLHNIFRNIRLATHVVSQMCEQIWAQLGVSPEDAQKQVDELRRLSDSTEEGKFC